MAHLKKYYQILNSSLFCSAKNINSLAAQVVAVVAEDKQIVPISNFEEGGSEEVKRNNSHSILMIAAEFSVTRLADLLDFGQVFKAFGNN